MPIAGIDHWVIVVGDVGRTLDFYQRLGFTIAWEPRPNRPDMPTIRIGDAQKTAHDFAHDKTRGDPDHDQPANVFGMAQGILGSDGAAEGMGDEIKRAGHSQALQHEFQIIYQVFHGAGQFDRIIAQAVPA